MKKRSVKLGLVCLVLGMSACVSKSVRYEVVASVIFNHADTVELNEAFKTIEGEKTVRLLGLPEAHCEAGVCNFPVRTSGPVLGPEMGTGKAEVRGRLSLTKVTTAILMDKMEQARIFGKEQASKKGSSSLSCFSDQCTFNFVLPDEAEISMDKLLVR